MSDFIDIEEFNRYIVYLEATKEKKSHDLTRIIVHTSENTGMYYDNNSDKLFTNKCFFISLAQAKKKAYDRQEIATDPFIYELMSQANFTDLSKKDERINLSDFDDSTNWRPHFNQVERMCKSSALSEFRIEIYFGSRHSNGNITTEPFPVAKFNSEIIDPNRTIRLVQLPDHYNCILDKSRYNFFHPSLLEMTDEEINSRRNHMIQSQEKIISMKDQIEHDFKLAIEYQLAELSI